MYQKMQDIIHVLILYGFKLFKHRDRQSVL